MIVLYLFCLQELNTYCDFPEVIDISIKQGNKDGSVESRIVSLTRQDNRILVKYMLLPLSLLLLIQILLIMSYGCEFPEQMFVDFIPVSSSYKLKWKLYSA